MAKLKQLFIIPSTKSSEIPNLFKLSDSKFMYSFCGGGLPTHIDDYIAEIASAQKY